MTTTQFTHLLFIMGHTLVEIGVLTSSLVSFQGYGVSVVVQTYGTFFIVWKLFKVILHVDLEMFRTQTTLKVNFSGWFAASHEISSGIYVNDRTTRQTFLSLFIVGVSTTTMFPKYETNRLLSTMVTRFVDRGTCLIHK